MKQNKNKIWAYNPEYGDALKGSDIDSLWNKGTTDNIMTVQSFSDKPDTVSRISETNYPGFYIYYLETPLTENVFIPGEKGEKIKLLPSVKATNVIDIDLVSIDEYFMIAKEALIGSIPQQSHKGYSFFGISSNGLTFRAKMRRNDSGWCFTAVCPILRENEMKLRINK